MTRVPIHHMTLRGFVHPTEVPEKVALCMMYLEDPERSFTADEKEIKEYMETLDINVNDTYFGGRMIIMEKNISTSRVLREFLRHILTAGGDYFLLSILEDRVDDDCNLHLRFNKDRILRAVMSGSMDGFFVTEDDNVIKATVKIASYPSKKEVALKTLENYINEIIDREKRKK